MITAAAAAGIIVVALGAVLIPGPNMMYLISRSISQGRAAGFVSLIGVALGFIVYLTATNLGLAVVFRVVPLLYTGIKFAGVAYLLYLAWQALRPGGSSMFDPKPMEPDTRRRLFAMGFFTNLLNPKAAVLYLSLIPQFIDPSRGDVIGQGFLLGGIQICVSMCVNSLIVLGAGSLALFLKRRPLWVKIQRWVVGTVLGGVAVALALDSTKPSIS